METTSYIHVKKVSEDAEEVWDLLNRHKTLSSAYQDLMSQVTKGEADIDELRMEIQSFTSAHTNHMLVQNSCIHAMQQKVYIHTFLYT
jgi:hypothetical protein